MTQKTSLHALLEDDGVTVKGAWYVTDRMVRDAQGAYIPVPDGVLVGKGFTYDPDTGEFSPPPPVYLTHDKYRDTALATVDREHAGFLRSLMGNWTDEERATWPMKLTGAREIVGRNPAQITALVNAGQIPELMALTYEAGTDAQALLDLADTIIARASSYNRLIGLASAIRKDARAGVRSATDPSVDVTGIPDALAAIRADIEARIAAAVQQWENENV